jgi:hypothetical protein
MTQDQFNRAGLILDQISKTKQLRKELFDAYDKHKEDKELKSLLNRIQSLSTTEGVYKDRYAPEGSTFACDITQLEKDAKIEELESAIESLQDELDYFNATTEI